MQTLTKNHTDIQFPGSTMNQIIDTTASIYPFVCLLRIKFENGDSGHASGTLINGCYVLTAAHNVKDKESGKAVEITVIPGQNADLKPFGEFQMARFFVPEQYEANPVSLPAPEELVDHKEYIYDYALIELKNADKRDNPLRLNIATDEELTHGDASITGYPGDKPKGTMWEARGKLRLIPDEPALLFYQISTFRGDSGAGVIKQINDQWLITGIHVAGSHEENTNFGVRITQEALARINKWMQQ